MSTVKYTYMYIYIYVDLPGLFQSIYIYIYTSITIYIHIKHSYEALLTQRQCNAVKRLQGMCHLHIEALARRCVIEWQAGARFSGHHWKETLG